MKKTFLICCLFTLFSFSLVYAVTDKEEIINLEKEVSRFERELPFFTKSKMAIFLSFGSNVYDSAFYGIYLNQNLVKTGFIDIKNMSGGMGMFVGDFPVRAGENKIEIKLSKDKKDVIKKFNLDIPQFRKTAAEFLFTGSLENPSVNSRAWVVD